MIPRTILRERFETACRVANSSYLVDAVCSAEMVDPKTLAEGIQASDIGSFEKRKYKYQRSCVNLVI